MSGFRIPVETTSMKPFSPKIAMVALAMTAIMLIGAIPLQPSGATRPLEGTPAPSESADGKEIQAPSLGGADVPTWDIGYSWNMVRDTYKSYWEYQSGAWGTNLSAVALRSFPEWSKQQMSFVFTVEGIENQTINGKSVRVYNCSATGSGTGQGYTRTYVSQVSSWCKIDYQVNVAQGDGYGWRWYGVDDLSLLREKIYFHGQLYLRVQYWFLLAWVTVATFDWGEAWVDQWDNKTYYTTSNPVEVYDFPINQGETHTQNFIEHFVSDAHQYGYDAGSGNSLDQWSHTNTNYYHNMTASVNADENINVGGTNYPCKPVKFNDYTVDKFPRGTLTGDSKGLDYGAERWHSWYSPQEKTFLKDKVAMWFDPPQNIDQDAYPDYCYYKIIDKVVAEPADTSPDMVISSQVTPSVAEEGSFVYVTGNAQYLGFPASGAKLCAEMKHGNVRTSVVTDVAGNFNATLTLPASGNADYTPTSFDVGSHGIEVWDKTNTVGNWYHDLSTVTIIAGQNPVANAGPDLAGDVGVPIAFSGALSTDNDRIASYSWNFGDTQTGSGKSTSHAYASDGVFTATLTVTDAAGRTAQDTVQVTVTGAANIPPTADAGLNIVGTVDFTANFDGSGSTDPDGTIVSYYWTFTYDATPQALNGVSPTFNFQIPGVYEVTLTVTDDDGATDTDTVFATANMLSFNAAFASGWNLMSFPVNTEGGKPLSTFFADEWTRIQAVMAWDPATRSWLIYERGRPDWMNTLKTIDEKHGYWVKFNDIGDGILTVQGKALATTTIELHAGWNLVGFPSDANSVAGTVLAGTGYDNLQKFDGSQTYLIFTMLGTENMIPGKAYWVHVAVDTSFEVIY